MLRRKIGWCLYVSTLSRSLLYEICLLLCMKNPLVLLKIHSHCTEDLWWWSVPLLAAVSHAPCLSSPSIHARVVLSLERGLDV